MTESIRHIQLQEAVQELLGLDELPPMAPIDNDPKEEDHIHDWAHFYGKNDQGDHPEGRRCQTPGCSAQEWYKTTIITHIPDDMKNVS